MKKILILFLLMNYLNFSAEKGIKVKKDNFGKRWAICIGINDYNDNSILDLETAKNDATSISEIFKTQGDFDYIYTITDDENYNSENFPTYWKIKDRINYIKNFIKENDLLVFTFSGHGVSIDNNSYLLTKDSRLNDLKNTSINLEKDIIENFKNINKKLFLIDACRENMQEGKGINKNPFKIYEIAEIGAVFYSTKEGYYSYEDKNSKFGVFSNYIIEGLKGKADDYGNKDNLISFNELSTYVEENVALWSLKNNKMQIPYTKIYGEKYGDLILSTKNIQKINSNKIFYSIFIFIIINSVIIFFLKRRKIEKINIDFNENTIQEEISPIKKLMEMAENGNSLAQYELAESYFLGIYIKNGNYYMDEKLKKDEEKSFYWYKKSAENNNSNAQFKLAEYYYYKNSYTNSFYWYKQAADNGNVKSYFNVGLAFQIGEGIAEDLKKSFEYYKKGAELGNAQCILSLANAYSNAMGIEKNLEKAIELYKEAYLKDNNLSVAISYIKDIYEDSFNNKYTLEEKEMAAKVLRELECF